MVGRSNTHKTPKTPKTGKKTYITSSDARYNMNPDRTLNATDTSSTVATGSNSSSMDDVPVSNTVPGGSQPVSNTGAVSSISDTSHQPTKRSKTLSASLARNNNALAIHEKGSIEDKKFGVVFVSARFKKAGKKHQVTSGNPIGDADGINALLDARIIVWVVDSDGLNYTLFITGEHVKLFEEIHEGGTYEFLNVLKRLEGMSPSWIPARTVVSLREAHAQACECWAAHYRNVMYFKIQPVESGFIPVPQIVYNTFDDIELKKPNSHINIVGIVLQKHDVQQGNFSGYKYAIVNQDKRMIRLVCTHDPQYENLLPGTVINLVFGRIAEYSAVRSLEVTDESLVKFESEQPWVQPLRNMIVSKQLHSMWQCDYVRPANIMTVRELADQIDDDNPTAYGFVCFGLRSLEEENDKPVVPLKCTVTGCYNTIPDDDEHIIESATGTVYVCQPSRSAIAAGNTTAVHRTKNARHEYWFAYSVIDYGRDSVDDYESISTDGQQSGKKFRYVRITNNAGQRIFQQEPHVFDNLGREQQQDILQHIDPLQPVIFYAAVSYPPNRANNRNVNILVNHVRF